MDSTYLSDSMTEEEIETETDELLSRKRRSPKRRSSRRKKRRTPKRRSPRRKKHREYESDSLDSVKLISSAEYLIVVDEASPILPSPAFARIPLTTPTTSITLITPS